MPPALNACPSSKNRPIWSHWFWNGATTIIVLIGPFLTYLKSVMTFTMIGSVRIAASSSSTRINGVSDDDVAFVDIDANVSDIFVAFEAATFEARREVCTDPYFETIK